MIQVDLASVPAYLANSNLAADVCALHYIHEPAILWNLERRSEASEPYTLLGSVLVAVNPLQRIPDPEGILGKKKASSVPHPYGIAEVAYSQMVFAEGRKLSARKATDEVIVSNQSIVISGESGSGKTESAKMCLRHLVSRNESAGGMHNLDERLLSSNPILEAFGNASTVRNHNSSRFGKLLKLHFVSTPRPGEAPAWTIGGASVVTYLLERSRITTHNAGERGYHIFYQLRDGAPADLKSQLGLDTTDKYRYMTPLEGTKAPVTGTKLKVDDKEDYAAMDKAFNSLGINADVKMEVYKTLAGILHLGNVEFDNDERPEGDVAVPKKGGYGAVELAASLLGVEPDALITMLVETEVKAGTEMVKKKRDANAASFARDAVAKAAYSALFDWTVETVNQALILTDGAKVDQLPFIGVLDIFGFESFERNDFEQLLINYANEALQGTFNRQVFQAELDLYKREGLIVDDGGMPAPPDNSECMELLAGKGKAMGLLKVIDAESQTPQPTDQKMNKVIQKTFEKNACMMKPHPKDAASTFIVRHYAGAVVYTVGRFIEKNADRLPKEVGATFEKSKTPVVKALFAVKDKADAAKRAFGGASIIGKFTNQIASFIRCVKPCTAMVRTNNISQWFDRRYVTMQLKCLSIPQTAEVLKAGLPTRVPYEVLTENYMGVLPAEAIKIWKGLGGGDLRSFMTALFWAFEVPENSYRTGTTKVFFKSGELTLLDKIMESAAKWSGTSDPAYAQQRDAIVKRFKYFYVRSLWRKSIVKIMCYNRFNRLVLASRKRVDGATKIESLFRMVKARQILKRNQRGAIMAQKLWRAKLARRIAAQRRLEAIEEARRKAEELKRKEEEARIRAEEERKAAEAARIKAEEERKAAEAAAAAAAEEEKAAMLEKLEQLKKEEEEARVAEEKRRQEAEAEAERFKKEREAAEAAEMAAIEQEKVAKEREEREAAERQKRWEEEEAAAAKRAQDEPILGGAKGRNTMGGRKKSVVREMKAKPEGVSKEEKARRIEQAEAAISLERGAWSNSGKVGYLMKQEKAGLFGGKKWKPKFFMLKMIASELEVYDRANSTGLVGEPKGKPKARFHLTRQKATAAAHTDAKLAKGSGTEILLKLTDPKDGELVLACKDAAERDAWLASISSCLAGFQASPAAAEALEKAKALKVESAEVLAAFAAGTEQLDYSKLPIAAQEQLQKIDSLLETGLLSKEEVDQLKPVILKQAMELMNEIAAGNIPADEPIMGGGAGGRPTIAGKGKGKSYKQAKAVQSSNDALGYDKASPNVIVVCTVCSIVNAHGGPYCQVCSTPLPKPNDPAQQERVRQHARMSVTALPPQAYGIPDFGPPDGKWLVELPYTRQGGSVPGTIKIFVKEAVSVMDSQTWEQVALYVLGLEYTQQGQTLTPQVEQWTCRHNWAYYGKSRAKLLGALPNIPEFPDVTPNEATSTRAETMKRLKAKLSEWLGAALAQVPADKSQAFFENEAVDKFFKIKENVQADIGDQYADVYQLIKTADFGTDSSMPLGLDELLNADDAATLLMAYLQGDGGTTRALPVSDERVQDMRSVCLTAIPRLKASTDETNPNVVTDLVPQAWDVLEHVEKALALFNDSELISLHGKNPEFAA